MPSDTPPLRPTPGTARPQAAGGQGASPSPPGSFGPPVAAAARDPNIPTILNPALRRFWHREDSNQEASRKPRDSLVKQSFYWAFAIIILVAGASVFDNSVKMIEPPKPTPPGPASAANVPADAPLPIVVARPEVVSAFGQGAVVRTERLAQRFGAVSEQAVMCGSQPRSWPIEVRDALVDDILERTPSFDEDTKTTVWLQEFLRAQFGVGQMVGARSLTADGRAAVCAVVPQSTDYFAAIRLMRAATAIRQERQFQQSQFTPVEELPDPTKPRVRD